MDLNETKDATSKGSKRAWLALIFAFLLALSGVVAYLTAHDFVTNLFSFADEDKDVTVEWREVPPTVDVDHDGSFLVVRIAWNNTTATYVEGSTTTTLNAYSVGNEGSYEAPDPYIFLADNQTEEYYQALLIGSEVTVTNSATPIPTGKLFYIEKDRGNTEHPRKNGVTYSKYRMTVKPYTTTVIKQSQLKHLLSVQPVSPQWSGYIHNGWTAPVKVGTDPDTGNDKYVVKSTWVKRSNPDVTDDSSYAAVYGDDTLVFGRGLAPGSYDGKPLSSQNDVACTWYDIEDAVYSRVELPWREMKPNIKSVVVKDTIAPKSIAFWFETMANLTSVDLSKLDASQVEDAQSLFGNDAKISTIDMSMLEMPKVKNISNMFYGCKAATSLKLPGGITSELNELGQVFYDCVSVTKLNLEGLEVSGVTNMSRLFWNCASLTTVYVDEDWSVQHIRDGIAEGKYDNHGQMFSGCNKLIGGNGTKCSTGTLGQVTSAASIEYANIDQFGQKGYLTCKTALSGNISISSSTGLKDVVSGTILTASTSNLPAESTIAYQWLRDGSPIEGETTETYQVSEEDHGTELTCRLILNGEYSMDSNVLYGGYPAFAIYSDDDKSFCFYKRAEKPKQGDIFEGKTVTRIYTNFEHDPFDGFFDRKWGSNISDNVVDVRVEDKGIRPTSTARWFQSFKNCTGFTLYNLDTSKVTDMSYMFYDCRALPALDIAFLDVSNVESAYAMFSGCQSLKYLYSASTTEWKIPASGLMFENCRVLQGSNGTVYDRNNVTGSYARADGLNGQPGYFNAVYTFDLVGDLKISGVAKEGETLTALASDVHASASGLQTNAGKLAYQWFRDDTPIEGATGETYTLTSEDASCSIHCVLTASNSSGSITSNKIGPITAAKPEAFAVYSADDNSLNFYKRSSVPSAGETFEGKAATEVYTGFEEQAARPWSGQAANVTNITFVDKGITPVSTTSWFSAFTKLLDINGLSKLDTSKVTSMQNMFNNCRSLTSFDISSFDTSQVTDMRSMFNGCYKLASLDLSNFDTSNVTNMKMMFTNCSALTSLDLSSFDTSGASDISFMFSNCKTLETIFVAPGVDWSSVQTSTNMFINCSKLTGGNGTKYDQTKIDAAYARIDGLNGQPGYFTDKNAPEKTEVEKQLESMTLHEKVCQMFCVYPEDLGGSGALTVAGSTQQKTLQSYPYGGVCYFLQNIKNETQAKTLVSTLESYSEIPLFHAVDEEGGRVQRIGGTTYSGAVRGAGIGNQLNAMYTYKDLGTDTAYNNAQLLAANLNLLGMNWDFAPVADVNSNPSNPVIGDRAYGDDFDATGELVASAVRGFNDAGVATSLKHFPGHGDTATDSHTGAASVSKTLDQLRNEEFKSFKAGIAAGADSVMMGHLMIEGAKESVPTSCSYEFVTEVLRNELGFDGVITTDGMGMGAITKVYGTTKQGHIDAVMACLNAGIDVFLLPGDPAACVDAIEAAIANGEVSEERIDASVKRILTLKEKIAANKSKRNAATLQAMHAAAVADEELTKAATKATSVEPTVSVEANAESVAVGNKATLSATTEGIDETDHVEYRWFVSSNSDMADKAPIENATQAQIEYAMQDPGSWYIQCEVTYGEEHVLSDPVTIETLAPEGRQ